MRGRTLVLDQHHRLPFVIVSGACGLPSPAADHLEKRISLDDLLDVQAPHIYLERVEGGSMIGAGIYPGDLVLVDRSIPPEPDHIVVASELRASL